MSWESLGKHIVAIYGVRALWGVFGHVLGGAWQVDFVAIYGVRALWGVFGHVLGES